MTDGAHLNLDAETAMGDNMSGMTEEEVEEAALTDEQFEQMIRQAPMVSETYSGGANAAARIILEAYEEFPQLQEVSDERVYLGETLFSDNPIALNVTLTDVINRLHERGDGSPEDLVLKELTGFMWGWAVNAARTILDLEPLPNPALMTFDAPQDQ